MINPIAWAENGRLPYWLIRFGIRKRLAKKLNYESSVAQQAQEMIVDELSEPLEEAKSAKMLKRGNRTTKL